MKKQPKLTSPGQLKGFVDAYFDYIKGEYHLAVLPAKSAKGDATEQKVWDREPEPATLCGLALHLGFESRKAFDEYQATENIAKEIRRARLRIEAEYEKRLHQQSPTGAMFVLKSMGWNDKEDMKTIEAISRFLKIELVTAQAPPPASNEKEVAL